MRTREKRALHLLSLALDGDHQRRASFLRPSRFRSNKDCSTEEHCASHKASTCTFQCSHGPRLYVCQAPNAFICVSSVSPPKHQMRLYVCHQMRLYVCHQMRLYVCHQMRLYVCRQIRLYVCHQMRLLTQRSSLRSLTFARFARTFFNSLNWNSCLKSILV